MNMRIIFKNNHRLALLAPALALVFIAAPAHADRRAYGTTYEAVTAPKGELDVELWSTYARDGEVEGGPPSKGFRNMLELEYGLTERWDVALYNLLDTDTTTGDTGYGGAKLETRYRLLPAGTPETSRPLALVRCAAGRPCGPPEGACGGVALAGPA